MAPLSTQADSSILPPGTFTEHQDIPLDVCEEVFSLIFESHEYKEWWSRPGKWQLRVTGPPGSGKTILSALTKRKLEQQLPDHGAHVASIFIKRRITTGEQDFLREVLLSVLLQLSTDPNVLEDPTNKLSLDVVKSTLHSRVQSLDRVFLIVDDVDACGPAVKALQTELDELRRLGLKVMSTSRVPLHYEPREFGCDIKIEEHPTINVYWCCKICHGEGDDFDWDDAYYVCHICYAEQAYCKNGHDRAALHEPYSGVDLNLPGMILQNQLNFHEFVARELEIAHGDLGLNSKVQKKPPLSPLGKELAVAQSRAAETVRDILEEASSNIAIAKMRLGIYQTAQTMDDLETTKDRLPDEFLAIFDAAVDRVLQQPESEKLLGLAAILVVSLASEKIPFDALQTKLVELGLLGDVPIPEPFHNIDRVLHAVGGLLFVEVGDLSPIQPYHHLFSMYVKDNYNEDVFQARCTYLPESFED